MFIIAPFPLIKVNEETSKLLIRCSYERTELPHSIRYYKHVAYISDSTEHAMFKLSLCCTKQYENCHTHWEVRGTNVGVELHLRAEQTGAYNYISNWKSE
jgi:hypothetical protein